MTYIEVRFGQLCNSILKVLLKQTGMFKEYFYSILFLYSFDTKVH